MSYMNVISTAINNELVIFKVFFKISSLLARKLKIAKKQVCGDTELESSLQPPTVRNIPKWFSKVCLEITFYYYRPFQFCIRKQCYIIILIFLSLSSERYSTKCDWKIQTNLISFYPLLVPK